MDKEGLRRELSEATPTLRRLLTYLIWILEQSDEEQNMPNIAWDWEMFQEALYPYYVGSVYSGVLWYGLECLRASSYEGDNWKIIIPEGTRQELLVHLKKLASKYKRHLQTTSWSQQQNEYLRWLENSVSSQWQREDWKDALTEIFALQQIEKVVDLLLLLIRSYVRPSPFGPTSISEHKVKYYQERLSHYRHESGEKHRNVADAYNLATTEKFEAEGGECQIFENAYLVTATPAVNFSGPSLTRDPIYFAIEMEMRRQYPDVTRRKKLVLSALAHISELLVRLGDLAEEDGVDLTRRQDVRSFLEGLSCLYDDPVLRELGRLATRAMKAVENSMSQAKQLSDELIPVVKTSGRLGRLRAFLHKINMILESLEGKAAKVENFGLVWTMAKEYKYSNRYIMRGKDKDEDLKLIMEAEKGNGVLTLRWVTEDSLPNFYEAVERLSSGVGFGESVHVCARAFGRPGTKDAIVKDVSKVPEAIRNIVDDVKLSLLRLDLGQYSFWYEIGELVDPDYTRNGLNPSHIAVKFPKEETNINIIAEFFEETSADWYPSATVAEALNELRNVVE